MCYGRFSHAVEDIASELSDFQSMTAVEKVERRGEVLSLEAVESASREEGHPQRAHYSNHRLNLFSGRLSSLILTPIPYVLTIIACRRSK